MSNSNNPLISIVIPTYNHAPYLKNCLNSIIAQTFKEWEAIVVNNYSEDNTIDVINGFTDPRIRLVNFRNNGIIAASRNEGVRLSRGEFIAFLDSDDWWYPKKLETVGKFLPGADVVFHDLDIIAAKRENRRKKGKGRHLKKPIFADLMRNENALSNSSVVVRKDIINKVGGLSEDASIISVEDFDLWLRISRITERFVYVPVSLGTYRIGEPNISASIDKHINSIKKVYNRHLSFLPPKDRTQSEMRMNYCIARIVLNKRLYDQALDYLKKTLGINNLSIKMKTCCLIAMIYFKKYCKFS